MFTISLLQTSGSRKGTRYKVESTPFNIGRGESCDLTLNSRTVSRNHCYIAHDDSGVLIRDCGSRNGTLVDGEKIPPESARVAFHHTVIQLGKYTFRLSVRSKKTGKPIHGEPVELSTLSGANIGWNGKEKGVAQLLDELDELATNWDSGEDEVGNEERGEPDGRETIPHLDRAVASEGDSSKESNRDADLGQEGSSEESDGEPNEDSTVMLSADQTEGEEGVSSDDETSKDKKKQPRKLPAHLRPQGPKDPKIAATEALRNLFTK